MIYIQYPSGAGGRWLSNLIYRLESGRLIIKSGLKNFHSEIESASVQVSHNPPKKNIKYTKFSGRCTFNFYINALVKTGFDQLENQNYFKLAAKNKLQLDVSNVDLDYQLLDSPRVFADSLFNILDKNKLQYQKNYDFVEESISAYKKSCPDLTTYFNNSDSELWQAWCSAVNDINSSVSVNEFTLDRSIFFKNTP